MVPDRRGSRCVQTSRTSQAVVFATPWEPPRLETHVCFDQNPISRCPHHRPSLQRSRAERSRRRQGQTRLGTLCSGRTRTAGRQRPPCVRKPGHRCPGFSKAMATQFADALAAVGVVVTRSAQAGTTSSVDVAPAPALYEAEPSGQALMQRIAATRHSRATRCLMGADVLLASAQEEHTIAARAFAALGVTKPQLTEAAHEAIAAAQRATTS